jgi:hypothetical protein
MSSVILAVMSLIGVLAVGVVVPFALVNRAEKTRREDRAHADKMHREDRDAEWARQDAVAAKTNGKLTAIHSLVDGGMTAAMRSEADAMERELAVLGELAELRRATGQEPSPSSLSAIDSARMKLATLRAQITERTRLEAAVDERRDGA